jgi:hypothetical protein
MIFLIIKTEIIGGLKKLLITFVYIIKKGPFLVLTGGGSSLE